LRNSGVPQRSQKARTALFDDGRRAGSLEHEWTASSATHMITANGPPVARRHVEQWQ
jgi:hypothetical protein